MGVRDNGITLVDNGGGGPGTSVDIVTPIGQDVMANSVSVVTASDQTPIDVNATITIPPGIATEAKQDTQIAQLASLATEATLGSRLSTAQFEARINTQGQKNMAASTPVVIASDQSALPISVGSLPLPTGAATEARQDAEISLLSTIDLNTSEINTNGVVIRDNDGTPADVKSTIPIVGDRGLVTRQVGLPDAIALADAIANPTLTAIATFPFVFNGTTWDRLRGNSSIGVKVDISNIVTDTDAFVDGSSTALPVMGGAFSDSNPDLSANQFGIQRITKQRAAHVNLRDNDGIEVSPLTDTQLRAVAVPVSGNVNITALVSDVPESYLTGSTQPLSLNSDGRLRVSTVPASIPQYEDLIPDVNLFGSPYPEVEIGKQLSPW